MNNTKLKTALLLILTLSIANCGGGETGSSDLGPVVSSGDVFSGNSGVITLANLCSTEQDQLLSLEVNDIRNDPNRESNEPDHLIKYGDLVVPYYIVNSGYEHGPMPTSEDPLEVDFDISKLDEDLTLYTDSLIPKQFLVKYAHYSDWYEAMKAKSPTVQNAYTLKQYSDGSPDVTFFDTDRLVARTDDSQSVPIPGILDMNFPEPYNWLDKAIVVQICDSSMVDGDGNIVNVSSNPIIFWVRSGF